ARGAQGGAPAATRWRERRSAVHGPSGRRRDGRIRPRLPAGTGRRRLQAAGIAVSIRPHRRLAKDDLPARRRPRCRRLHRAPRLGRPAPGGGLRFVGKLGTGVGSGGIAELAERLEPLTTDTSPFVERLPADSIRTGATWVEPRLVVEVAYSGVTDGGRLRHPRFRHMREDKDPADVAEFGPGEDDDSAAGVREDGDRGPEGSDDEAVEGRAEGGVS